MAVNLIKQIGRYQFPILAVTTTIQRIGWRKLFLHSIWRGFFERPIWRGFFLPRYDVFVNGQTLRLTSAEKEQLDKEWEKHETVMKVWGMCKSAGLRA